MEPCSPVILDKKMHDFKIIIVISMQIVNTDKFESIQFIGMNDKLQSLALCYGLVIFFLFFRLVF